MKNVFTGFAKGTIAGFVFGAIIFGSVFAIHLSRDKDREIIRYAEKQIEIEALREDYVNRDAVEFLEVPGVGDAIRDARTEFERKRDEALYRFRSGPAY